jgi:hypothetical protein
LLLLLDELCIDEDVLEDELDELLLAVLPDELLFPLPIVQAVSALAPHIKHTLINNESIFFIHPPHITLLLYHKTPDLSIRWLISKYGLSCKIMDVSIVYKQK